jgi:arsenate reductase
MVQPQIKHPRLKNSFPISSLFKLWCCYQILRRLIVTTIYGIKNCDTMKKAFKWLEAEDISYEFIDYKKTEPDTAILKQAINEHGWETVINQRGTTWRKLDNATKETMNAEKAIPLALKNPSILKRPLLIHNSISHIGFKPEQYKEIFE